jgi:hypothetical protein
MTDPVKNYQLILTEEDKTALVNIIELQTFKGSDVEYVADIKKRIQDAPEWSPNK